MINFEFLHIDGGAIQPSGPPGEVLATPKPICGSLRERLYDSDTGTGGGGPEHVRDE